MRYALSTGLMLSVAVLFFTPVAAGADNSPAAVYKPPMRGAPASRVGGGTRGSGAADFVLNVLAPDHTGLTTQAQPTLYWYASGPSVAKLEVTVIADVAELPVLSQSLNLTSGGVQSFDLAKHGITLKPDTEYEWYVSVVPDPDQRSKDVTSGGTIRRVAPDPAVQARAAAAGERQAPLIYAEAGLWYDAIDALSRLIELHPGDAELHAERAALLDQVGLPDAASYDRSGSR
jgi:Domain of Unknown Function (DUF928)